MLTTEVITFLSYLKMGLKTPNVFSKPYRTYELSI